MIPGYQDEPVFLSKKAYMPVRTNVLSSMRTTGKYFIGGMKIFNRWLEPNATTGLVLGWRRNDLFRKDTKILNRWLGPNATTGLVLSWCRKDILHRGNSLECADQGLLPENLQNLMAWIDLAIKYAR